jgi:hypothetical protein
VFDVGFRGRAENLGMDYQAVLDFHFSWIGLSMVVVYGLPTVVNNMIFFFGRFILSCFLDFL